MATLVVNNGSGMHSTLVGLGASRATFPKFAGRCGRARRQLWQWHVCSWFCWYLRTSRCVPDDCRRRLPTRSSKCPRSHAPSRCGRTVLCTPQTAEQLVTVPSILYFLKQTVDSRGRSGGPRGFLPEQSSTPLTFQLQVVAFREVFKVFPTNRVPQRLVEQNIVFQQRLPSRTLTFQFLEVACTVSLFLALQADPQYRVLSVETGFCALFRRLKKCDTTSALWV